MTIVAAIVVVGVMKLDILVLVEGAFIIGEGAGRKTLWETFK